MLIIGCEYLGGRAVNRRGGRDKWGAAVVTLRQKPIISIMSSSKQAAARAWEWRRGWL